MAVGSSCTQQVAVHAQFNCKEAAVLPPVDCGLQQCVGSDVPRYDAVTAQENDEAK